ncbi:MAG TPA: MarR family transcriptional regulator [Clostridia bacterium]|nr:MarR family transcriptional regulator [Clostridia bacterium]
MTNENNQKQLRESIRMLERKLGLLNDSEMCCCKVTMAQCHAIVEIGRAGSISLAELAGLLNLDNSTMSRTVNNLVNSGHVMRELDPGDRRYVTIALTDSGKAVFDEIESGMDNKFAMILDRIPEDKKSQVLESLELLNEALENCCC